LAKWPFADALDFPLKNICRYLTKTRPPKGSGRFLLVKIHVEKMLKMLADLCRDFCGGRGGNGNYFFGNGNKITYIYNRCTAFLLFSLVKSGKLFFIRSSRYGER
jgi:hypothetical protein